MSTRVARRRRLGRVLASASQRCIKRLWSAMSAEPKSVFDLFCTRRAVETWGKALSRVRTPIRYSAVFTHQRPYVRFGAGGAAGKCEIADLLLVLSYPKKKRRQALLLQAKKTRNVHWPPSDDQWRLYSKWPPFSYVVGHVRRTGMTMPHQGPLRRAQYLLMPRRPAPVVVEACQDSLEWWPDWFDDSWSRQGGRRLRELYCRYCGGPCVFRSSTAEHLAWTLSDLMLRDTGAAFDFAPTASMDDWSTLVWDLLRVTAFQCAPRKQVGLPKGGTVPRGISALFLHELLLADPSNGGAPQGRDYEAPGDEGGFGVVHLEIGGQDKPVFVENINDGWGTE